MWAFFVAFCFANKWVPCVFSPSQLRLSTLELYFGQFAGMVFMFINIIPEFFKFGMASRHFSDSSRTGKLESYLSKNALRVVSHVVAGFAVFNVSFLYLMWPEWLFSMISFSFFKWFIICVNIPFTLTIWLLTRNHDVHTRVY
eukprot:UN28392